jgi:hypothetical protein
MIYRLLGTVGIIYKDREWSMKLFESIVEQLPRELISCVHRSSKECECILTTGDVIRTKFAGDVKGLRFNRAFIEESVTGEDLHDVYSCMISSVSTVHDGDRVVIDSKPIVDK